MLGSETKKLALDHGFELKIATSPLGASISCVRAVDNGHHSAIIGT